jgi:hypothetical protein
MSTPIEPIGSISHPRLRLDTGVELLEQWAATVGQAAKNAIYKVLFAISDGSVYRGYKIIGDVERPWEFFVLVKENLVVKVRVHNIDSFGIIHIGAFDEVMDHDDNLAA